MIKPVSFTLIANIFNGFLRYKLHQITKEGKPYGIQFYNDSKYFEGGVGTDCYYSISEFIHGKFERVGS